MSWRSSDARSTLTADRTSKERSVRPVAAHLRSLLRLRCVAATPDLRCQRFRGRPPGSGESAQLGWQGNASGPLSEKPGAGVKARHRDSIRVVRQAASVCLGYPEHDVIATSGLLRTALADDAPRQADSFEPLLAFWDSEEPSTIQTHYVDVFDLSRKHSLYLSYWTD